MNPLWMTLSSLASAAALSGVFFAQASLRHGRVAWRRLLRESGRLPSLQEVAGESEVLTHEGLPHTDRTVDGHGWNDSRDASADAAAEPSLSDLVADPLIPDRDFLARRGPRA